VGSLLFIFKKILTAPLTQPNVKIGLGGGGGGYFLKGIKY